MRILAVLGTRPEIIKTAPVIKALKSYPQIETRVCLSSQHKDLAVDFLNFFKIAPDYDLKLNNQGLSPHKIATLVSRWVQEIFRQWKPNWALVQGDTSTALGAALGSWRAQIPVAHIEAGLRSPNIHSPRPEEKNRRTIDSLAKIHFAPSPLSAENLIQEKIPLSQIFVTGNTGIDSLKQTLNLIEKNRELKSKLNRRWGFLSSSRKLVFVTFHRRENLGARLEKIFDVLLSLAKEEPIEIIYPVHPRPSIRALAEEKLKNAPHIFLSPPLDYPSCVYLIKRAHFIITDSGGIQEEAPVLGKPLILARSLTERPEGILQGAAVLAPTAKALEIYARDLIRNSSLYKRMARPRTIYGTGNAASQIAQALSEFKASPKPAKDRPRNHFLDGASLNVPAACG